MKKPRFTFFVPKRFYRISEIAGHYGIREKTALYEAAKIGALYRVGNINLINRTVFEAKYEEMTESVNTVESRYCLLADAMSVLGLNEKQTLQLASDAKALIKLDQRFLVALEELEKYILRFRCELHLIDEELLRDITENKKRRFDNIWVK